MKLNTFDAWVITLTDVCHDRKFLQELTTERHIRVWTRKEQQGINFRQPSLADEYVRKLKPVWGGVAKLGVEKVKRCEVR